jgi:prepilin-type N-terminal cleavage/methylation domain-containing protein
MKRQAFTLIELLVVIAIIAVLASLLFPALHHAKVRSQSLRCLNNQKQLTSSWSMYATDSSDSIVYASDDGTFSANPLNQFVWTLFHMDFNPANHANWDVNFSITTGPIWPYHKTTEIYKCCMDKSFVKINGTNAPRVRSYAINLFMGGFLGDSRWYTGQYKTFTKESQMADPSKLFVFIEEREDCISWGNYMVAMRGNIPDDPSMYYFEEDMPTYYHANSCAVSFADNHAEVHKWRDRNTLTPVQSGVLVQPEVSAPESVDVRWLQSIATHPY